MKTPVLIPVLILAGLLLVMLACSTPSSDHELAKFWKEESDFWMKAAKFWRDDTTDQIDALQVRVEQLEAKQETNLTTRGTLFITQQPPAINWEGSMRPPVDTDVHLKFDGADWHETFRIQ